MKPKRGTVQYTLTNTPKEAMKQTKLLQKHRIMYQAHKRTAIELQSSTHKNATRRWRQQTQHTTKGKINITQKTYEGVAKLCLVVTDEKGQPASQQAASQPAGSQLY